MTLVSTLLTLHILGGTTALLSGPIPMLARKGGPVHRKTGQVFAVAMALSSASAFILALIVHNKLLLTIAVLTAFLIGTGLRAARFRRGARPNWTDRLGCVLLASFSIWLLYQSASPPDATGLFFALGALILVARQIHLQRAGNPDWLLAHIAGMGGAYVATVTAFLVVNLSFLPKPVIFIVPTVIGSLLITWASLRHATPAGRPIPRSLFGS